MSQAKKDHPIHFEKSLEKLDSIVEKMEQGDLPLEQSLKYFEEGVALIRQCQQTLTDAEQKVSILTQRNGEDVLESFEDEE